MNFSRLVRWKYSPTLLLAGANTLCAAIFQLGILWKLGVGAQSDLYFASIVVPMVLYTLAFGALNNVLIPMFVETRATVQTESTLLWNSMLMVVGAGVLLLLLMYYPVLYLLPVMFRKLAWIDLGQVGKVLLVYSAYQTLFSLLAVKNCFLLARERHVVMQMGVFCGWFVSLFLVVFVNPVHALWRIPLCLVVGNAVALAFPNLRRESFGYHREFFRSQSVSLASRVLPVAFGGSVTKIEPIVDGVIASFFKEGSLTIFYFFCRVMFYVSSVTFSGYVQPEQKQLADAARGGRWKTLSHGTSVLTLRAVLISTGLLSAIICACAVLFICGFASVKTYVAYFTGEFLVFFLLLGYLYGLVAGVAYANSLYVVRREKLFLFVSVVLFPLGVLLKIMGAYLMNLPGLAAGTSLYWLIYAGSLALVCSRSLKQGELAYYGRMESVAFER